MLAFAVLIASTAAILIRVAQGQGAPSLTIAAWRLTLATLVLTPLVWLQPAARREVLKIGGARLMPALLAGVFLALHFATWIGSLAYTSVANSGALVASNPIWIALASWLIWGERPGRRLALGVAAALAGSLLIFAADAASPGPSTAPMLGNALALAGSLAVCGYLLIGRKLRASLSLLPYIWVVYGAAALTLIAMAMAAGQNLLALTPLAWACVAGLALGPQLLGHSSFNWAVKHVSPTLIAVVILGEPVGSALWASLFLGEGFSLLQLAGFTVLLVGIFLAASQGD